MFDQTACIKSHTAALCIPSYRSISSSELSLQLSSWCCSRAWSFPRVSDSTRFADWTSASFCWTSRSRWLNCSSFFSNWLTSINQNQVLLWTQLKSKPTTTNKAFLLTLIDILHVWETLLCSAKWQKETGRRHDYFKQCCKSNHLSPHVRTMCLILASSCCWKPSSSSRSSLFWNSAKLCSIISSIRADRAAFSYANTRVIS